MLPKIQIETSGLLLVHLYIYILVYLLLILFLLILYRELIKIIKHLSIFLTYTKLL